MRSYQTLSVVAGVLSMVLVIFAYLAIAILASVVESLGGGELWGKEELFFRVGVSVFLYILAIIIPFVVKDPKTVGYALIMFAIVTLVSAGGFGIIGFALLIAAGIVAIRWKEKKIPVSTSNDILKERYAKGEITKEEFDKIKEDLK